MQNYTISN